MQKLIITLYVIVSTMLISTTLMASPKNSEIRLIEEDIEIHLEDVQLPPEIKQKIDNELFYCYTPENYQLILHLYNTCSFCILERNALLADVKALEHLNSELLKMLDDCDKTLKEVDEDRNFAYKLNDSNVKKLKLNEKKNKLKIILWAGGSALIGIAAGILIGVFGI